MTPQTDAARAGTHLDRQRERGLMATHYPPGMDGATVMRNTANAVQATLRDLLASDLTVEALDDDMLQIRIPGMHARHLLRIMDDRGVIQYPRISTTLDESADTEG